MGKNDKDDIEAILRDDRNLSISGKRWEEDVEKDK